MKSGGPISAGVLLLLLGAVASMDAQESRPEHEGKPAKQAPKHAATPRGRLPADSPSPQGHRVAQGEQRGMWHRYRAGTWRSEHRTWRQRGGYIGFRIPEDHFRGNFGRDHWFRIYGRPLVMVGGRPRFQYGGYWFTMVDPWPEYWADNWYETDDVYIDYYDDGYYLYDRSHPDDRIAVNVFEE